MTRLLVHVQLRLPKRRTSRPRPIEPVGLTANRPMPNSRDMVSARRRALDGFGKALGEKYHP